MTDRADRAYPTNQATLPRLPQREPEDHKGRFGLALVVGGSRGMTGAVALAGMAALRGGSGLVRLAVPEVCLDVVAAYEPSYMTIPLPSTAEGQIAAAAEDTIRRWADSATCVAVGPGLGRSGQLDALVGNLYREEPKPMVVDADGLNALATRRELLSQHAGPRILTPHPGEFARLLGQDRVAAEDRNSAAVALARRSGAIIVLKGHRTCITDGTRTYLNTTGNPGMATGGSGDVLTGLVTALVCQGLDPMAAARLAVHLHGLAGDLAADAIGQVAMIASDLLRFLPQSIQTTHRTAD